MGSKQIAQETFDDAVQENITEFEMDPEEAVREAVQQFESQGVDLSNIVKAVRPPASENGQRQKHQILLVGAQTGAKDHGYVIIIEILFCPISLGALQAVNPVYSANITKKIPRGNFCRGRVWVSEVGLRLCSPGQDRREWPQGVPGKAQVGHQEGFLHGKGAQALAGAAMGGLGSPCLEVSGMWHSELWAGDKAGISSTYPRLLQALSKLAVGTSRAGMCCSNPSIPPLSSAAFRENSGVLSELCATLSRLSVRNEFCQEIVDLGGLHFMVTLLADCMEHPDVVRQVLSAIRAVAGNDDVKDAIVDAGATDLIVLAISHHLGNPQICEQGCAALCMLALRKPENCSVIMEGGGALAALQAMKAHPREVAVQ
ncbi:ARMC6 protein, partial [Panurus biarmicus]|nr:ARMC6 protein [Panurus biarmicus]